MTNYATVEDLVASWPKVHTSNLTHDEMRTMLARAQAIVDTYLSSRYTVAVDPAPDMLKWLTVDLAMMDVLDRSQDPPAFIVRRIERAYEMLGLIRDGTLDLPGAIESAGTMGVKSSTSGFTPTFGTVPSLSERVDRCREDEEIGGRGGWLI